MQIESPPRHAGGRPTTATRTRRRLSAAVRRAQLTEVALRLFASRGFGGTTTKAIADAAGVSEGIIFRHFASKDDLYAAILEERVASADTQAVLATLQAAIASGDDARVVRETARQVLIGYRKHADLYRMMLFAALEGVDLARASQRSVGTPVFTLLRDYVRDRQAAGVLREGAAELLVFALLALPTHFATATTLFGRMKVCGSDDEVIETFTALILDGVRVPVPPRDTSAGAALRDGRRKSAKTTERDRIVSRPAAEAVSRKDPR